MSNKSTTAVKKSTFRTNAENYKQLSDTEHVFTKPNMYIGSIHQLKRKERLLNLTSMKYYNDVIKLPEGMERIFIELLSNAIDNTLMSIHKNIKVSPIKVTMNKNKISIRNGGIPIPIEINKNTKLYVPDMIFGNLRTSSNYDKGKTRFGVGTNGVGAKICNILSKEFIVEIGDPHNKKKYYQRWTNGMKNREEPKITDYDDQPYVEITYHINFEYFGYSNDEYPQEAYNLFAGHVADGSINSKIETHFNDTIFDLTTMENYMKLYIDTDTKLNYLSHYEWVGKKTGLPKVEMYLVDTPDKGRFVAFTNGLYNKDGGIHVDSAYDEVASKILHQINGVRKKGSASKKEKNPKITKKDIRRHLSVFISCHIINPDFNSQLKSVLKSHYIGNKESKKIDIKLTEKETKTIMNWNLIKRLENELKQKSNKELSKTDGKKHKRVNVPKLTEANKAGTNESSKCVLILTEGDSAKTSAIIGIGSLGEKASDYYGAYALKGKLLNVMDQKIAKIAANKELADIKRAMGLEEGLDYTKDENYKKLRYGKIWILADADVDGKHIVGLILNYFYCRFESLIKRQCIFFLRTPIIRAFKNNSVENFYSEDTYNKWSLKNKGWDICYYKGLGSSSEQETKDDFKNLKLVTFLYDNNTPDSMSLAFGKRLANQRKIWLKDTIVDYSAEEMTEQPIPININNEFIQFSLSDNARSIPKNIDGLKICQRKIIYGALKEWGKSIGSAKAKKLKIENLASSISTITHYHHGAKSLEEAILKMGQAFVGSNNLPYFQRHGNFGTRLKGGKDAAAARYPYTNPESWIPYVFMADDMPLLKMIVEEGQVCEPEFFIPIIPMHIINGSEGIGTGWSTFIPPHKPMDVVKWLISKLKGTQIPTILPRFQGFKGQVKVELKTKTKNSTSDTDIENENEVDVEDLTPEEKEQKEFELLMGKDEVFYEDITESNPKLFTLKTVGKYEVSNNKVIVTELPIGRWTEGYERFIMKLMENRTIRDYNSIKDAVRINFELIGLENPSLSKLKLERRFTMSNMVTLDLNNKPQHHKNVREMLEDFYEIRLSFYEKRKEYVINNKKKLIDDLERKIKFIELYLNRKIIIDGKTKEAEIFKQMNNYGFLEPKTLLKSINLLRLTFEKLEKLKKELTLMKVDLEDYSSIHYKDLWLKDLENFVNHYNKNYKNVYIYH